LADTKNKYCWNIDVYQCGSKSLDKTVSELLTLKQGSQTQIVLWAKWGLTR